MPEHWAPVLKHVARKPDWDRVPAELEHAVQCDLRASVHPDFLGKLHEACASTADLFGADPIATKLDALASRQLSQLERGMVEMARGLHAQGRSGDLADRAARCLAQQILGQQIEHVSAAVRKQHGSGEAAQVQARLSDLAKGCDFDSSRPAVSAQEGDLLDVVVSRKRS